MWAEIDNDQIVNLVECDEQFAQEQGLVEVPEGMHIGMVRQGDGWDWPEELLPTEPAHMSADEEIRVLRERLDALETQLTGT